MKILWRIVDWLIGKPLDLFMNGVSKIHYSKES
jgi:hypothetical protein